MQRKMTMMVGISFAKRSIYTPFIFVYLEILVKVLKLYLLVGVLESYYINNFKGKIF